MYALDTKKIIDNAKIEIFISQNPDKALELLENFKDKNNAELLELIAYSYFIKYDFEKAFYYYDKISKQFQKGYCALLFGDSKTAKDCWIKANESPAVIWGLCLVDYINLKVSKIPSYFQLRTFYEKDLSALIKVRQLDFAENLINCSTKLLKVNLELNKFNGKALYFNGYIDNAIKCFKKSLALVDKDPDVYYYLARCFAEKNDKKPTSSDIWEIKTNLKQAIYINKDHFPSKKMIKEYFPNESF